MRYKVSHHVSRIRGKRCTSLLNTCRLWVGKREMGGDHVRRFFICYCCGFRNMKHLFNLEGVDSDLIRVRSACLLLWASSVQGGNAKSTELSRAVPEDCVARGSPSSATTVVAAEEQRLCVTSKDCQAPLQQIRQAARPVICLLYVQTWVLEARPRTGWTVKHQLVSLQVFESFSVIEVSDFLMTLIHRYIDISAVS